MTGAIILAGGEGNRIGGKKPLMKLGGEHLISYVLNVALRVSDEAVVVVSRDDLETFETLLPEDVKVATDILPGGGPLIGVNSGLKRLRTENAMVLPCDCPFIDEGVLRYLESRAEGADAAVPLWPNGYMEPLHAVYRVSSALKASEAAIREGRSRVHSMIERLKTTIYVPVGELRRLDPDLLTFFNINSKEDLRAAEAILRRRKPLERTG